VKELMMRWNKEEKDMEKIIELAKKIKKKIKKDIERGERKMD